MTKHWMTILVVIVSGLLLLIGCGGGGGGASSNRANIFVTDNIRDGFSAVYGTIYKVELVATDGTISVVFSDSAGKSFNFRKLNDGTRNYYEFLSQGKVDPTKTYSSVNVTLAKELKVVPNSSTVATTYNVVGTPVAGDSTKVVVSFNLTPPRSVNDGGDLSLDFDLANFVVSGSNVTPSIKDSSNDGIDDPDRHDDNEVQGTVQNLSGTSPNFTFDLNGKSGTIVVTTSSATVFFNSNGTPNPELANGKRVEVEGIFNTTTERFEATRVKIRSGSSSNDDPNGAQGLTGKYSAITGDIDLLVREPEGFLPNNSMIVVHVTDTTVFRAYNGAVITKAEFFTALDNAGAPVKLEVEGTYNSTNNVFTATKVKLEDGDDHGNGGHEPNQGEARGRVTAFNATAGTATINLSEFEGFTTSSTTLDIATTGDTEYKLANGTKVSKSDWFAAIDSLPANQRLIKVEGVWNGTVMTASELKIDD